MGRGRAKAKQTKVARELKYRTFDTDFNALQRELHGDEHHDGVDGDAQNSPEVDDEADPYDPDADGVSTTER